MPPTPAFSYMILHLPSIVIILSSLDTYSYVFLTQPLFFFFFQAEDGIRDDLVTGVQTCALPISPDARRGFILDGFPRTPGQAAALDAMLARLGTPLERCVALTVDEEQIVRRLIKIGRASCRERV